MRWWSQSMRYGWRRALVHLALAITATPAAAAPQTSPAPQPPSRVIWAFGDSLTAGYGLPPEAGFTTKLQAALRRAGIAATVRNGGVAGDTAAPGVPARRIRAPNRARSFRSEHMKTPQHTALRR